MFGMGRTITHDRAPNIVGFGHNLAAAIKLDAIFGRNPTWAQPKRRLALRAQGGRGDGTVDDVRPRHLTGNIRAGSVADRTADIWARGCAAASAALVAVRGLEFCTVAWFRQCAVAGATLAVPRGDGHRVGVGGASSAEDEEEVLAAGSAAPTAPKEEGGLADALVAATFDAAPRAPGVQISRTFLVDGKAVCKATAARLMLDGDSSVVSSDRLKRVQGLTVKRLIVACTKPDNYAS